MQIDDIIISVGREPGLAESSAQVRLRCHPGLIAQGGLMVIDLFPSSFKLFPCSSKTKDLAFCWLSARRHPQPLGGHLRFLAM